MWLDLLSWPANKYLMYGLLSIRNQFGGSVSLNWVSGGLCQHSATIPIAGLPAGWFWLHIGIDAVGNLVAGWNTTETYRVVGRPITTTSGRNDFLNANATNNATAARIADWRIYNHCPPLSIRQSIYHSHGADGYTTGLVHHAHFFDLSPGSLGPPGLATDVADPGAVWSYIGANRSYSWLEAPYPRERRRVA